MEPSKYISNQLLPKKPPKAKKIWCSVSKPGNEISRLKEELLLKQLEYTESHIQGPFKCGLHFFHSLSKLCKKPLIRVNIPETLIFGYGFELPTLMYTDHLGFLRYKPKLNSLQLDTLHEIVECHRSKSKKAFATPLALIKASNSLFNRILMQSNELLNELHSGFKTDFVMQRYVLPKGNKACKIRVVWEENSVNKYFYMTNKIRLDGKEEEEQADLSQKKIRKNLPETSVMENSVNKVFGLVKLNKSKIALNRNKSDAEILQLGKKYQLEKRLAGQLIEMGTLELKSGFRIEQQDHKDLVPEVVIVPEVQKIKPKQSRYLKSITENDIFPINSLFKKLISQENQESLIETDITETLPSQNPGKLRSIFCIDTHNKGKALAFEIKNISALQNIEKMMKELKKAINLKYLAYSNEHISQFVCDFCEDSDSNFYLLKVKFYKCKKHPPRIEKSVSSEKEFECPGKYCYKETFSLNDYEENTEKVLNGPQMFKIFKMTLMENEIEDLEQILKPIYHQTVDVCKNCFNVYMKKEQELLRKQKKPLLRAHVSMGNYQFTQPIKRFKSKNLKKLKQTPFHYSKSISKSSFFKDKHSEVIEACRFNDF